MNVPLRPLAAVEAEPTVKVSVPLPVPPVAPVNVIHALVFATVQAQADPAVTAMVPLPPTAGKICPPGLIA